MGNFKFSCFAMLMGKEAILTVILDDLFWLHISIEKKFIGFQSVGTISVQFPVVIILKAFWLENFASVLRSEHDFPLVRSPLYAYILRLNVGVGPNLMEKSIISIEWQCRWDYTPLNGVQHQWMGEIINWRENSIQKVRLCLYFFLKLWV